jgi:hypothetical protein
MMEATDARHAQNACRIGLPPFENTAITLIFVQGVMDAIFVVIVEVLSNKPPQMGFAHDHWVQQLSARAANPALRHAVLPGTAIGRSNQLASEAFQHPRSVSAEFAITIKDQVLRSTILREGFSKLLYDPLTGGMLRGIEVRASPCRCLLLLCSVLRSQSQARQACQSFRKNRKRRDMARRQEGS